MKHVSCILLFLLISISSTLAQTGQITGRVLTVDNQPAGGVSVEVRGHAFGAVSGADGAFRIDRVKPGQYTLIARFLGLQAQQKPVIILAGETTTVTFTLTESATQLQEVRVSGNVNKFAGKETDYVARLPIKNIENPQVYNVISADLMKEQVVVSFDDALRNAPGVNRLWTATGRAGDGAGYFSMRGFSVQPTMINGVGGLTNGAPDPAGVERIETIKGPSGTLFGSSLISFGGLINIVTKRPYDTFGGDVSLTAGSYGLTRLTADVNAPLNDQKTALFRLNAAYHYEGSFQDAGFRKNMFLAPSLTIKASPRLSFTLNADINSAKATNPLMVFLNRSRKLIATTPTELGIDFNRSFTGNDITIQTPTTNLYAQATYKLSDQWVSQTNLSRSIRRSEGYYSYVMFLEAANDTLLTRYISDQTGKGVSTTVQQNFIGDFSIGKMRNRLVVGVEALGLQTHNNNTAYIPFDKVSSVRLNDPRYNELTRQALDAKLGQNTAPTKSGSDAYTYSVYASDVLNVTSRLIAMLSLRLDRFDNRGTVNYANSTTSGAFAQTALSPKFGLVYQLLPDLMGVFVNYMNGFRNVAPVTQPFADLAATFKPQQANQLEGGVKFDLYQHRLNLTVSYYDILVTNMTRSESLVRDGRTYNYTVQDGSQRSRGLEIDAVANPLPGLNIVAGFSHNTSEMVKAAASVEGRRPVSAGPANQANLWFSYHALRGKIKGLGFGFGGNYASENIITNSVATGQFIIPAYTVLNASFFYAINAYRLALKVDNLANTAYFGGWTTVEKQMPRRVMASVNFSF